MIMKNDIDRIRLLLDKYNSGETTQGEEAELRRFFASPDNDIPQEWQPYRALFAFVAREREGMEEKETMRENELSVGRRRKTLRIISLVSVAAMLLLLFSVSLVKRSSSECYMIVDGKKYTDRKEVKAEALEALQMMGESDDEDPFSAMRMMR